MKNDCAKTIYLIATFFFFCNAAFSQAVINTIDTRQSGKINISHFVVFTSDTVELNVRSVAQKPPSQWQSNPDASSIKMGISNKLYWFRFHLGNSADSLKDFYVFINNKGINQLELFRKQENQIISLGRTGDHYPFYQRPYISGNFFYPVSIAAGDTATFYLLCNKKNENLNFSLELYTAEKLRYRENKTQLFMGLFLGIMVLGFIISLQLFFIFKDKLPFWCSLYILGVINWLLTFEGMDFHYFYPDFPFYTDISRYVASSIILALMIYIMQLFCYQQSFNSRFFHATNITKWTVVLFIPLTFIVYRYFPFFYVKRAHFIIFIVLQSAGMLLLIISCLEKIIQQFKPAIFYFIAVALLLVAGNMALLMEIGIIYKSSEPPHIIQWSFIIEMILIIVGILYRYNLMKKENDLLYAELNEQKVNSIKQILFIQQEEQQRIAEDLHDILGGHLSAIKIKITALNGEADKKQHLSQLIDEVVVNTRNIAHNLVPVLLHDNEISSIISSYVNQLNKEQAINFKFIQTGIPTSFKKEAELDLYKILMEIIQNILKHSGAFEATIQFLFDRNELQIMTEDNGRGMLPQGNMGMGMKNIFMRVKKLDGTIHIDSSNGNTTFIIIIPTQHE